MSIQRNVLPILHMSFKMWSIRQGFLIYLFLIMFGNSSPQKCTTKHFDSDILQGSMRAFPAKTVAESMINFLRINVAFCTWDRVLLKARQPCFYIVHSMSISFDCLQSLGALFANVFSIFVKSLNASFSQISGCTLYNPTMYSASIRVVHRILWVLAEGWRVLFG